MEAVGVPESDPADVAVMALIQRPAPEGAFRTTLLARLVEGRLSLDGMTLSSDNEHRAALNAPHAQRRGCGWGSADWRPR